MTATGARSTTVPALSVQDVTVRFAGVKALTEVSFTVQPGTIHALIGPNGAGKSTCFNVISGVYRATQGRVMLGERDLTTMGPHQIAGLGIGRAFQNIALSARQSVLDNILLGRHHLTRVGFVGAASVVFPDVAQARRLGREARSDAALPGC